MRSRKETRKKVEILAVEDSPTQAEQLKYLLEGQGYVVTVAANGREALTAAHQRKPTLIISDIVMPEMDGYRFCKQIKSDEKLKDIPVVLLTELSRPQDVMKGLECGADNFITKPYEGKFLLSRVDHILTNRELRKHQRVDFGVELYIGRRRHFINAERQQILDLLISTYEEAVRINEELHAKQMELERSYRLLEDSKRELEESNRKLKEAQTHLVHSEKMASLGQLVAGVAHEINNPLAFVLNHLFTVESALDDVTPQVAPHLSKATSEKVDKIRDRVIEIRKGLLRVKDLVLQLRTFSRLDEGEFKAVDIHESIESVLLFLQHRMRGRIQVEKRYGSIRSLSCFPGQLNQVVMNLVANAVEAIEGHGTITIITGRKDGMFFISVRDTGKGIPKAIRHRVFEPFFTTKPVGQGTGLGLAISYSVIQAHQGTIEFQSAEGKGTEFLVKIPLDLKGGRST